jgi:hypothetical protein
MRLAHGWWKSKAVPGVFARNNDNSSGALDLVIQVPQGMNADISDGSGDLKVLNVGSLDATDGSGDFSVAGVRNVTGSFTVESDGSGSIYATDIRGSVIVQNDGSGEIDVNKVGRDFKVESKSGSYQRPICVPRRVSCIIICAARSVRSRTFIA